VTFRITIHSGFAAPADALDLLWPQLDAHRGEVRFVKVGGEIRVTSAVDTPMSLERDERERIGRRAVLDIVRSACESAPEIKSDWFAVSPLR
jgi:hypothetical protein